MKLKKKVLIVSYSYPPSNAPAAQRPYAIAKYLDKDQFDVTVLTCSNQDSSMGLADTTDIELPGVTLIKIKALGLQGARKSKSATMKGSEGRKARGVRFKSFIFRVLSWFLFPDKAATWIPFVWWYRMKNRTKLEADVVFSTSPLVTNHLIARMLCWGSSKRKHIADFRDFHHLHNDAYATGFKGWMHKRIEMHLVKKANTLTFISNGMKNEYSQNYPRYTKKMVAIYNGFDPEEFSANEQIKEEKKLTFFYAGSFYGGLRSPKPLLLTLEQLYENGVITLDEFSIEIAGNMENHLLDEIRTLKIFSSIVFLGLLQRKEVLRKYSESHVLWSIVINKPNHYTGVPIKFYEYLGAQRYILNYATPIAETTRLVKQLNCGWTLPNSDVIDSEHINTIETIFEKYRNRELNMPLRSKKFAEFHRAGQTQQLQQLL